MKKAPKYRKIDKNLHFEDWFCEQLILSGFTNRCISDLTGLTSGQIQCRVTKFELTWQRFLYRNGESKLSKKTINQIKAIYNA